MMKKLLTFLSCVLLSIFAIQAQDITASGVVVDESGVELIGASVIQKGTTRGAVTGTDGRFSLKVPKGSTLTFSMIGMKKVELPASTNMKVVLEDEENILDDVMVVAYGTTKKSSFTGSAGVVDAGTIDKLQVSSVSKALEGTVPGLVVASDGGQPGSNATMRIRGYGSIAAGNAPLIVLDGIVFDGNMNTINPQDIESITVLKDAASAALYGSRAANGVILITTKRGKEGKTQVTLEVKQGINVRGIANYDVITDPNQYMSTYWTALYNQAINATTPSANPGEYASQNLIPRLGYNPYIGVADNQIINSEGVMASGLQRRYTDDWLDEAYRTGYRQEYNVNISSGSQKATSYLSLGYLNDKGIIHETGFNRFSVRENLSYELIKGLNLNGSVNYVRTEQDQIHASTNTGATSNLFSFVSKIAPIYPIYQYDAQGDLILKDGQRQYDYGSNRAYAKDYNPLGSVYSNKNKITSDAVILRGSASYELPIGLTFSANLGYDLQASNQSVMYSPTEGDAVSVRGRVRKTKIKTETLTANQLINYTKTFDQLHTLSLLVGHESYKYTYDYFYGEKTGMFQNDVDEFNNAIIMSAMNSFVQTKSIESYLSQVLYDYDNRYYFSSSFRRDGSSIFAKDHRWGNFWSVGGSWRISEEDFFNSAKSWMNNFRLRLSYGTSGNDQMKDIDGYSVYKPYADQYEVVNNNGEVALVKLYKGNPKLTWEKNQVYNIGLDLGFLNNRFTVEFDAFIRKTSDLLLNYPLPTSTGDAYMPENLADMKNSGIEFVIGADIIKTDGLRWNITLNGSHVANEITKLPKDQIQLTTYNLLRKGGTIGDFYLIRYAGVNPENGESLWYYNDKTTGELKTTNDDTAAQDSRYIAGSLLPSFTGGLTTTLEYANFDLSIMTNFQIGGKVLDTNYATLMGGGTAGTNWHKDIANAWTPENNTSNIPRVEADNRKANVISDRFLTDASFLNIRNITLGYKLPGNLLKKLNMSSLRVSLSADNLGMFTKRQGFDPRNALSGSVTGRKVYSGTTDYGYTPIRSFSLGISANF